MRTVYRNPKELATCLKDAVDSYLEDLISYEKLEDKIRKIVAANEERVYKGNIMISKVYSVLGEERANIINKIIFGK